MISVAATIAGGIVDSAKVTLPIVFAGLRGAITRNGNAVGVVAATLVAAGLLLAVWLRSRRDALTASNVNDVPAARPVSVAIGSGSYFTIDK